MVTLLDLLSNSLVLHQTAPYLDTSSVFALAGTSKDFWSLTNSPEVTRYLDLSRVKGAVVHASPIDNGGVSWRAERMDESLTEDEFYCGPLRGIFTHLHRKNLLRNVSTLILDGLTVPTDLIRDVVCEEQFNVRILSVRECQQLNQAKLMQLLRYIVRPSRAPNTPKLKGLYVFGPKDPGPPVEAPPPKRRLSPPGTPPATSIVTSRGAQIGAEWNEKSSLALTAALTHTTDKWYQPSGRMVKRKPPQEWAETLLACEGIIAFDAVVCRGPRHDPNYDASKFAAHDHHHHGGNSMYLPPAIATVALGPSGCAKCESSIEGPAIWGRSPSSHFPLLAPPPLHSSTIKAAQQPHTTDGSTPPPFIARCEECLRDRWCERCNKWWDEPCYHGGTTRTQLQQQELMEDMLAGLGIKPGEEIKAMGSRRECFGCGRTCVDCVKAYIRNCTRCRNDYCIEDNEGSTATMCDWCNRSGRRTRLDAH